MSEACKKPMPIVFDSVLPKWHYWAVPQCVYTGKLFCSRSLADNERPGLGGWIGHVRGTPNVGVHRPFTALDTQKAQA